MKKKGNQIEVIVWIAIALLIAIAILIAVVWRGKNFMTDIVEKIFSFLRFGP